MRQGLGRFGEGYRILRARLPTSIILKKHLVIPTTQPPYTGIAGEMAGEVDQRNSVEVYGLQKRYAGGRGFLAMGCSLNCCSACEACSCKVSSHPGMLFLQSSFSFLFCVYFFFLP